ncbi:MAG: Lpg1974 family pore-forming outer membrane protein [Nitrospinales bacterium]
MIRKKILFLLIAAIFLTPSIMNLKADPQLGVFVPPDSKTNNTGYYAFGEGLFLRGTNTHDYAIPTDDDDEAVDAEGDILAIGYGRDGGFRAGFGRNIPNSPWDVSFTASYIKTTGDEFVDHGDIDGVDAFRMTNTLIMIAIDDAEDSISEADNITSRADSEIYYFDLAATHRMRVGSNFDFGVSGGLRFASVENSRSFLYIGHGCGGEDDDNSCSRDVSSDFNGGGLRLGIQAGWASPVNGLSAFMNTGFSMLVGEKENSFSMAAQDDDTFGSIDDDGMHLFGETNEIALAPVIDMQIGVTYVKQLNEKLKLTATVGYEFQGWLDMMERVVPQGSIQIGDDDDVKATAGLDNNQTALGLEGVFFRVGGEF